MESGTPTQPRAENVAALVNGLVVLLGPPALFFLIWALVPRESSTNTSATVSAGESALPEALAILRTIVVGLFPFALIAAWRTRVHAVRWREQGALGSRGVSEAGLLGFGVAVLYLAPGIVTRPHDAPPYVIFYGGVAFGLGLLVGLILQAIGLLTLKLYGGPRPSTR